MARTFSCSCCLTFKCLSLRILLSHINRVHGHQLNFKVKCCIDNCPVEFTKYNSLYKHTLKHHGDIYFNVDCANNGNSDNNNNIINNDLGETSTHSSDHVTVTEEFNDNNDDEECVSYNVDASDEEFVDLGEETVDEPLNLLEV